MKIDFPNGSKISSFDTYLKGSTDNEAQSFYAMDESGNGTLEAKGDQF